jgi:hypothetical protein
MAAIVTTFLLPESEAGASILDSFLKYHLAIGFAHIILFNDAAIREDATPAFSSDFFSAIVAKFGKSVSLFTRSTTSSEEIFKTCSQHSRAKFKPYFDDEVQARQVLNAEHAYHMCESMNIRWLLHIDIDEIFYISGDDGTLEDHLAFFDREGIDMMTYTNHEAVPETFECSDYFREVTLFKMHHFSVPLSGASDAAIQYWRKRTTYGQYMLAYDNGKSIVRVGVGAYPKDVHRYAMKYLACVGHEV